MRLILGGGGGRISYGVFRNADLWLQHKTFVLTHYTMLLLYSTQNLTIMKCKKPFHKTINVDTLKFRYLWKVYGREWIHISKLGCGTDANKILWHQYFLLKHDKCAGWIVNLKLISTFKLEAQFYKVIKCPVSTAIFISVEQECKWCLLPYDRDLIKIEHWEWWGRNTNLKYSRLGIKTAAN